MLFGDYRISATLKDSAMLPPYKGSTFRGVFGGCLRRAVCAIKNKECDDCLLSSRCIYARLFERKAWHEQADARTAAPPHPYIIQPPETERTVFKEGEAFDFNLLLFGDMNTALPYFVYAFELMGEQGIGKKNNGQRARFRINSVECDRHQLYSGLSGKLLPAASLEKLGLDPVEPSPEESTVTIKLHTPLRLKSDNHLQAKLDFSLLTRAMLRRVSSLFNMAGNGEPKLDYSGMVERAYQVKTVDRCLHWHEWERYSNRQEKAMSFGGIMGEISFAGPLAEYLPLIRLCQKFHIGKQTSFGLGRYSVQENRILK